MMISTTFPRLTMQPERYFRMSEAAVYAFQRRRSRMTHDRAQRAKPPEGRQETENRGRDGTCR